jgi:glycosyltransferase involved in cell wall biosynthesis
MSRKVLVIAYFFPPLGGAGVQRMLKFVKYLPEYGYQPVVVSTRSVSYPARDTSLLAELPPATALIRARDPELLRRARLAFDYLDLPHLRALAGWPDEAAAWIPAACAAAVRAVRRHRPVVIVSSSPPFSAHVVASTVSAAAGLPWVADFRDEFTANTRAPWRTKLTQRLNAMLERRVIARASSVVVVGDYFELVDLPARTRRITIANGVDESDLYGPAPPPAHERFRLSFVGTLYGDLDMAPVTSALKALAARGEIDQSLCELRLVGNVWLADRPDAGAIPVVHTGYVEHAEAIAEMKGATLLVLYVPATSPAPSGKLFEYLASGRPILCVTRRDSLAFRLVEEWGAGRSAEPGDQGAIESAIAELYRRWESGNLRAPEGVRSRVLERYSRRRLAGKLADVLDAAIALGGAERGASRK